MASTGERPLLCLSQETSLGLKSVQDLLILLGKLAAASPDHSMKALHVLSRGQDILISAQGFLQDTTNSFLDVLKAIQELQETEIALIDSIIILEQEEVSTASRTINRPSLISSYLNRTSFSEQLERLLLVNVCRPRDAEWASLVTDVVKGDDLNWATRLVGTLSLPDDTEVQTSLHNIISTLDGPKADNAKNVQNDCILAVICVADEIISRSENRSDVFAVVSDIAAELNRRITSQREDEITLQDRWRSLSERLHRLPLCCQTDKALLVQSGERSFDVIFAEAQAEIDVAGARIRDIIPFGTDEPGGLSPDATTTEIANQQLLRVKITIETTTEQLEISEVCGRTFMTEDGEASTMLSAAVRLLNLTSNAITPASGIHPLNEALQNVISAVARFVVAFEALCPEQGILSRRLGTLATLISQLGAFDNQA